MERTLMHRTLHESRWMNVPEAVCGTWDSISPRTSERYGGGHTRTADAVSILYFASTLPKCLRINPHAPISDCLPTTSGSAHTSKPSIATTRR